MVSRPTPGVREGGGSIDEELLDRVLEERIAENRDQLLEPWAEMVQASPDLQAEIDRTVRSLGIFFRKWVVEIVYVLGQKGTQRFNELKESLDGISSRTLSKRLTELQEQGLVDRELYDEMPVRVEYSLTGKGQDVATLALPLIVYLRLHGPDA